MADAAGCALCGRALPLTFHHLIPRMMHRRPYFQRRFSAEQLDSGIDVCRPCHDAVHRFFDEQTLGRELNTLQALLAREEIQRHVRWAARQRRVAPDA